MSDERARLVAGVAPGGEDERRRETPAGIWEHYCEHPGCTKWGGWGFRGRTVHETVWFCFEHRPE